MMTKAQPAGRAIPPQISAVYQQWWTGLNPLKAQVAFLQTWTSLTLRGWKVREENWDFIQVLDIQQNHCSLYNLIMRHWSHLSFFSHLSRTLQQITASQCQSALLWYDKHLLSWWIISVPSGISCAHFVTQLTRVTWASNKQCQLKRRIIAEVFGLSMICLCAWEQRAWCDKNKGQSQCSLKWFVLQEVWGGRKSKKVSADLICGHVRNEMILWWYFSAVSFSDCDYKNPIYNRSTERLSHL